MLLTSQGVQEPKTDMYDVKKRTNYGMAHLSGKKNLCILNVLLANFPSGPIHKQTIKQKIKETLFNFLLYM